MARRAVLAEAARALLSTSRRCVRCAPRRTIPRVSRETSAPAIPRHRPDSPTGAPSDPFASPPRDRARNPHGLDTRALVSWTTASDSPERLAPSARELARRVSRRTFRGVSGFSSTPGDGPGAGTGADGTGAATTRRTDDLVLTEACVRRLRQLAADGENTSDASGPCSAPLLRIAVDGGGCSGFQYAFSLDTAAGAGPRDRVFEREGARVVVDDVSFEFVKGATVDYVEEMIRSSFAIAENPNSDGSCGCGVSFAAK